MKIILYKDVPNLGEEGDICEVAAGYARNYLIPRKFAVPYTRATEVELAQKQQAIARRKEEKAKMAQDSKTRIEAMVMEIAVAAGEKGRLFGSVTSTAVVDFLLSQGVEVERKKVELPEGGIKTVGTHKVKIKLYGGDEAELPVEVSASGEKPVLQEAAPEVKFDSLADEEEEVDEAYAALTEGMEEKADAEKAEDAPGAEETVG
ncbi:MAG: 50S ribosomal protein L9 [Spirochaetales bacterium]|nr:MAG: 50S ribosomal protein L9 [Spirochaetales bacterium]